LCGKNALAAAATEWLLGPAADRLGIDAVLGGTGRRLQRELPELRARCRSVALCGNVSTTVVIAAIEAGASIEAGIPPAPGRPLLEPDPELDLDGSDAAVKLCAVAGAVFGEAARAAPALAAVRREDVRALDPSLLRERRRRGATTRLVARADRSGALAVAYEEVAAGSPLAAPPARLGYPHEPDAGPPGHPGLGLGLLGT